MRFLQGGDVGGLWWDCLVGIAVEGLVGIGREIPEVEARSSSMRLWTESPVNRAWAVGPVIRRSADIPDSLDCTGGLWIGGGGYIGFFPLFFIGGWLVWARDSSIPKAWKGLVVCGICASEWEAIEFLDMSFAVFFGDLHFSKKEVAMEESRSWKVKEGAGGSDLFGNVEIAGILSRIRGCDGIAGDGVFCGDSGGVDRDDTGESKSMTVSPDLSSSVGVWGISLGMEGVACGDDRGGVVVWGGLGRCGGVGVGIVGGAWGQVTTCLDILDTWKGALQKSH